LLSKIDTPAGCSGHMHSLKITGFCAVFQPWV
jgi:hypothetical protein